MSALRYSAPGQPTRLIDEGPNVGRIHFTRGGIVGGSFVAPIAVVRVKGQRVNIPTAGELRATKKRVAKRSFERRFHHTPHEFANVERCGALMRVIKEPCARFTGHKGEHRSRYALENNAARKRNAGCTI